MALFGKRSKTSYPENPVQQMVARLDDRGPAPLREAQTFVDQVVDRALAGARSARDSNARTAVEGEFRYLSSLQINVWISIFESPRLVREFEDLARNPAIPAAALYAWFWNIESTTGGQNLRNGSYQWADAAAVPALVNILAAR